MLAISAAEWDGIQHRPHHFMRRSARSGWTVIYLEPPATLLAPLKNKQMLERWKNWWKGLRQVEKDVYLLAPPPILPFGNQYRWINKLNQWMVSHTIKRALKDFSEQSANDIQLDLYTFLHNAVDLIPHLALNQVIYDCVDDHAAFTGLIKADVVYKMEKDLMVKADVSFATARQLVEDRRGWSENFYLVPNGAEYEHFSRATQAGALSKPVDLAAISKPIVGFYGGISDWIDIPLLTNVAKRLPQLSFVFIGPVATQVEELKQLPNVFFLGVKPYLELPHYIQYFDTCLIPFRINKLTESVNPVKLFEYLSAGKPIVATPLSEVLTYKHVVEITYDEDEMVAAIEKTIQPMEKEVERVIRRTEIGRENSWDARWKYVISLLPSKEQAAHDKKE